MTRGYCWVNPTVQRGIFFGRVSRDETWIPAIFQGLRIHRAEEIGSSPLKVPSGNVTTMENGQL